MSRTTTQISWLELKFLRLLEDMVKRGLLHEELISAKGQVALRVFREIAQ